MKRDDNLWKGILEEIFEDFLIFFYPDAAELFDLTKGFAYLDKELAQLFPTGDGNDRTRYVDKLVKVFTLQGAEEWLLVHIEVQGYTDERFARRMFEYYYRILDKYDKPITAFAVFSDGNARFHPKSYETSVLGTRLLYIYNTYKITDQEDVVLKASNNPFALIVLAVKTAITSKGLSDEVLYGLKREIAVLMSEKGFSTEKQRGLLNFLKYYVRFDNQELMVKFEEELEGLNYRHITMNTTEYLFDKARREGWEKGREQGIELEKRKNNEMLKRSISSMLSHGLDIGLISSFTGLSPEQVKEYMR